MRCYASIASDCTSEPVRDVRLTARREPVGLCQPCIDGAGRLQLLDRRAVARIPAPTDRWFAIRRRIDAQAWAARIPVVRRQLLVLRETYPGWSVA